jgi:hypothetical protein
LTLTRHQALSLTADAWRITRTGNAASPELIASGTLAVPAEDVSWSLLPDGTGALGINNTPVWKGHFDVVPGAIGLLASPHSSLQVHNFALSGEAAPGTVSYLNTEAILGAGSANETWKKTEDAHFRYGTGTLSLKPGARAKWNVEGARFELWAPTGPNYGKAILSVDGKIQMPLDFHNDIPQSSHVIWTSADIIYGQHAIVLVAEDKETPLDSLSVMTQDK